MTAEEVESFNALFLTLTAPLRAGNIPSDDLLAQHGDDNIQSMAGELFDSQDMGVEEYSKMSPETIRKQLGWANGFDAPSFQPFRHPDVTRLQYTAWSHPQEFSALDTTSVEPPAPFIKQRVKWVQLVGIASIAKLMFTEDSNPKPIGILLADEVGVGKTLHSLGICAFINQIAQGRATETPDPPILC